MLRKGLALAALGLAFVAGPVLAATTHAEDHKLAWSFQGPFGQYDKAQLQRGYKVYREVCSACHAMEQLSFRNLGQKGGPFYDPTYPNPNDKPNVKALANDLQTRDIERDTGEDLQRPRTSPAKFPAPSPNH